MMTIDHICIKGIPKVYDGKVGTSYLVYGNEYYIEYNRPNSIHISFGEVSTNIGNFIFVRPSKERSEKIKRHFGISQKTKGKYNKCGKANERFTMHLLLPQAIID